ncbi:uncharacterized protein LOC113557184 [Rhopalosiphum maidis]|uniref:uncharacterized protein LOC113557184 n=1 Tax=Rhopalosiphum maidis TaxID=43146 RepID=UPI00101C070C|nr:uncharacterized protein LOC113557184 [Rhopalosiphum maidis]
MISFKILVILAVIFDISNCTLKSIEEENVKEKEDKKKDYNSNECTEQLNKVGFHYTIGFLNYAITRQYDNESEYIYYASKALNIENNGILSAEYDFILKYFDTANKYTSLDKRCKPKNRI